MTILLNLKKEKSTYGALVIILLLKIVMAKALQG